MTISGAAVASQGESRMTIQRIGQSATVHKIAVRITVHRRTSQEQEVALLANVARWPEETKQEEYRPSGERERGTIDTPEQRTRPNEVRRANGGRRQRRMAECKVHACIAVARAERGWLKERATRESIERRQDVTEQKRSVRAR